MNMPPPDRGRQFRSGGRGFAAGGGLWLALTAALFHRALDRIDRGLREGALEAWLPDGSYRILGGRGPGPVAEVELKRWTALVRLARSGSAGWYRAWARQEWSSPDPVALFDLFTRNAQSLGSAARARGPWRLLGWLRRRLSWPSRSRTARIARSHFDLGNDFYAAWLDETMTYSAALFQEPIRPDEELAYAQLNKVRALLDRLDLRPDQHLLDIGCGWGTLADIAADEYGANVTAVTLSPAQRCHALALNRANVNAGRVRIELADHREIGGRFDAIASVEAIEAIGRDQWPGWCRAIAAALKPGGRAAIQYIAIDEALFESYAAGADFIQTYIFPGGMLVSEARLRAAAEAAGLEWQDRRPFGSHYAETLRRWRERFDAAIDEGRIPAGFDRGFLDLWRYYLMYCEGGFRGGAIWVAQVTLVKGEKDA